MSEKDYIKRVHKELIDYYLYHGMYEINSQIDYVENKSLAITLCAPFAEEPNDLDLVEKGFSVEKNPYIDTVYNSLLGTHSRDKNYTLIGKTIDEFAIDTSDNCLTITIIRYFENESDGFIM